MLLIFVTKSVIALKFYKKVPIHNIYVLRGVCNMEFDDLKNEQIIIEIRALVDAGNDLDDIEDYCQFMKEMMLKTTSSLN